MESRKSNKKARKPRNSKKKYASRDEVRVLERQAGLVKTRQDLRNLGRSSVMPFLRSPQGPMSGAAFSTRQFAATFGVQSGLTNVGGASAAGQIVQSGATAVYFAMAFQLSDLTQSSTFAALFDQYRFERVRVHIRSRNPNAFLANTASPNGSMPTAYVVVDRDDATALTSISDTYQYDNVISFSGCDSVYIDLVPSVTPAVFASGAFSGYSTRDSDGLWLDIANTSIPNYGIKGAVGTLTVSTTASWVWDIVAEYVVSFRKTR